MQLLRSVATKAQSVTVFQQLPGWFLPRPHYHEMVDDQMRWRLRHVPFYQTYYRFQLYWRGSDGMHSALFPGKSNDNLRSLCEYVIKKQVGDDPELLKKVLPDYPPFCTRVLVDNEWVLTLKRDNVELVPCAVERVLPRGVEAGGKVYDNIDAIVYSTGFRAQDFLFPMTITGRGGASLRDEWKAKVLSSNINPWLYLFYVVRASTCSPPTELNDGMGNFLCRVGRPQCSGSRCPNFPTFSCATGTATSTSFLAISHAFSSAIPRSPHDVLSALLCARAHRMLISPAIQCNPMQSDAIRCCAGLCSQAVHQCGAWWLCHLPLRVPGRSRSHPRISVSLVCADPRQSFTRMPSDPSACQWR